MPLACTALILPAPCPHPCTQSLSGLKSWVSSCQKLGTQRTLESGGDANIFSWVWG